MIVLGVDPSITACGLGVVDRSTREILLMATVRSDTAELDTVRYRRIHAKLCAAIRTTRARAVAIEEQRRVQAGAHGRGEFNANNSKVSIVVGIAMSVAWAHDFPVFVVSPQRAKIAVLGKGAGNADKARVKAAVERMLGPDPERFSRDAADAVAVAFAPAMVDLVRATRGL